MINKTELAQVVTAALQGTDLFLVEVKVGADNVIDVALDSPTGVTLDHCIIVDKAVHEAFDQDVEDYELTVGSCGLTEPFRVLQQYQKAVGAEVEVLTSDGKKLRGILTEVTEQDFSLEVMQKVKVEGAKRPQLQAVQHRFTYSDVKYTKNIITV